VQSGAHTGTLASGIVFHDRNIHIKAFNEDGSLELNTEISHGDAIAVKHAKVNDLVSGNVVTAAVEILLLV
jgi:hypothetical protein